MVLTQRRANPMNVRSLSATIDRILEAAVWCLLAWLPLAFGGVQPVSHAALELGAGGLASLFVVRCLVAPIVLRWSWSFVALALFLSLIAIQAAPGSAEVLGGLAPENLRLWSEMTSDPALGQPLLRAPLSLNPAATATDLRLLCALAVLFLVSAQVLAERGALRRFLSAMVIVGAVVAVVALLQDLTGAESLLWLRKAQGKATAGPFVHYGHFSQFLNLTLGAGLGLLLCRLADRDQRNHYVVEDLVRDLGAPDRRTDLGLFAFFVAAVVAICLSRSRNGVLSMIVGGAATAFLLHRTRYLRGMGWSLAALGGTAFLVLLLVGFDPVYERLHTLEDESVYSFRLAIAHDALGAFPRFAWLGSGQGTFADVFPMFDTTERPGRAEHAENQFLELLVETGIVGFALVSTFVVSILVPWLRRLRDHRDGSDGALFGLLFGIVAVGFHATSDFGLRIPAVVALAMVMLGAVVGRTGRAAAATGRGRVVGAAVALLAATGMFVQVPAAFRECDAYEHTEAAKVVERRVAASTTWEQLVEERARLRGHLAGALEATPERADLHVAYATAAWWSVVTAERVDFVKNRQPLADEQLARLREAAQRIQVALLEVRRFGPIRGDLWSLLGQIGVEWLDDPAAAKWIERGFRFAPENLGTCVAWARQQLKSGAADEAAATYARAVRMGTNPRTLLPSIAHDLGRPDVALAVARRNPRWLFVFVQALRDDPDCKQTIATARGELEGQLRSLVASADAPAWAYAGLADFEAEAERLPEAIALYRRYLALVPNSEKRLSLVQLLKKTGELEAARQEVRRFLNYSPGHGGARRLLAELEKMLAELEKK